MSRATTPNPDAVYPSSPPEPHTYTLDNGTVITVSMPDSALSRLTDYLNERLGFGEDGDRNPSNDPFLADVNTLVRQASLALATLEVMSTGAFTSTDDKPVYAGGVVSPGNRIFTPQEAARNTVESIFALDGKPAEA